MASANKTTGLKRHLGLTSLAATGICSMLGAGINVIPFMIQRSVPGIGPMVLPAFMLAALPAVLAGLAYAILASAMPRAGEVISTPAALFIPISVFWPALPNGSACPSPSGWSPMLSFPLCGMWRWH